MTSEPYNLHHFRRHINPNQKRIIANMTFHTALVISYQSMRFVTAWYGFSFSLTYPKHQTRVSSIGYCCGTFQVFLCLCTVMDCLHSISFSDFIKASKLLVSIVPADLPARASSMAAFVSSFGSEYITFLKIHSTKLLRLLCSRFAALFKSSNKSLSNLKAVCFWLQFPLCYTFYHKYITCFRNKE